MTDCDHQPERLADGAISCVLCCHILSKEEFHEWLDRSPRLRAAIREGWLPQRGREMTACKVKWCSEEGCAESPRHLLPVTEGREIYYMALCNTHYDEYADGDTLPSYLVITSDEWPFERGEVLTLGAWDREVLGQGRKPSKWDVRYERFATLEAALECAKSQRGAK